MIQLVLNGSRNPCGNFAVHHGGCIDVLQKKIFFQNLLIEIPQKFLTAEYSSSSLTRLDLRFARCCYLKTRFT